MNCQLRLNTKILIHMSVDEITFVVARHDAARAGMLTSATRSQHLVQYSFRQLMNAFLVLKVEHILLVLLLVFCLLAHSSLKILAMQKYEIIQKEKRRIAS